MNSRIYILIGLLVVLFFNNSRVKIVNNTTNLNEVLTEFSSKNLEKHIKFLASDKMRGRGTGMAGYELAAEYVAAQFKLGNLSPGAADNSFFQPVYLKDYKVNYSEMSSSLNINVDYKIIYNYDKNIITTHNVIGKIEGIHSTLKNEYVVYTAHLDHEGIGMAVDGDSIYNGAYDNASGVGIMLEIARAFSTLNERSKRSILFIALAAEEKGLLGSEYFLENAPVPVDQIITNINIDMFLMEDSLEKVVALGSEYADFHNVVKKAATRFDIEIIPDPLPQESIFTRSDQFSFYKKGIPSLFIINDFTNPANSRWYRTKYHTPKDEYSENMMFDAGIRYARFNFLMGYEIARQNKKPYLLKSLNQQTWKDHF